MKPHPVCLTVALAALAAVAVPACATAAAPPATPSPTAPAPAPITVGGAAAPQADGTLVVRLHANLAQDVADGVHPTELQRRLLVGHYTTLDGRSGFVFDRSSDPPRARIDGDRSATALHGTRGFGGDSTDYSSDDHRIWLRVDKESGTILLFQGPNQHAGVEVLRDADSASLQ